MIWDFGLGQDMGLGLKLRQDIEFWTFGLGLGHRICVRTRKRIWVRARHRMGVRVSARHRLEVRVRSRHRFGLGLGQDP